MQCSDLEVTLALYCPVLNQEQIAKEHPTPEESVKGKQIPKQATRIEVPGGHRLGRQEDISEGARKIHKGKM